MKTSSTFQYTFNHTWYLSTSEVSLRTHDLNENWIFKEQILAENVCFPRITYHNKHKRKYLQLHRGDFQMPLAFELFKLSMQGVLIAWFDKAVNAIRTFWNSVHNYCGTENNSCPLSAATKRFPEGVVESPAVFVSTVST